MRSLPRVTEAEWLGGRRVRVVFSDGLVRELDFAGTLRGVFTSIDDDVAFANLTVDMVAGTLCWPGGLDLDPDVLHGDETSASGDLPRVVREYRVDTVA